ncbi:MAG: hypothetical protein JJT94_09115 [Bernardetiaceae bacterium]|nr:hypothetical protein [Bernardetiaceae bacterium]
MIISHKDIIQQLSGSLLEDAQREAQIRNFFDALELELRAASGLTQSIPPEIVKDTQKTYPLSQSVIEKVESNIENKDFKLAYKLLDCAARFKQALPQSFLKLHFPHDVLLTVTYLDKTYLVVISFSTLETVSPTLAIALHAFVQELIFRRRFVRVSFILEQLLAYIHDFDSKLAKLQSEIAVICIDKKTYSLSYTSESNFFSFEYKDGKADIKKVRQEAQESTKEKSFFDTYLTEKYKTANIPLYPEREFILHHLNLEDSTLFNDKLELYQHKPKEDELPSFFLRFQV